MTSIKCLIVLIITCFLDSRAEACNTDSDCNPPELRNETIPGGFISCDDGTCVCNYCFSTNYTTGLCEAIPGMTYADNTCTDHRELECRNDSDCYPPELRNESIPSGFISCCDNYTCSCNYCFSRNASSGLCETMSCMTYADNTCNDHHQSQVVAFVLSLFLTWTGAANFYIHKLELAIPQVLIGVFILFLTAVQFVHRQVIKARPSSEFLFYVCFAITMLLCWLEIVWWLVDMVIFGLNKRDSGSGCVLTPDM